METTAEHAKTAEAEELLNNIDSLTSKKKIDPLRAELAAKINMIERLTSGKILVAVGSYLAVSKIGNFC